MATLWLLPAFVINRMLAFPAAGILSTFHPCVRSVARPISKSRRFRWSFSGVWKTFVILISSLGRKIGRVAAKVKWFLFVSNSFRRSPVGDRKAGVTRSLRCGLHCGGRARSQGVSDPSARRRGRPPRLDRRLTAARVAGTIWRYGYIGPSKEPGPGLHRGLSPGRAEFERASRLCLFPGHP